MSALCSAGYLMWCCLSESLVKCSHVLVPFLFFLLHSFLRLQSFLIWSRPFWIWCTLGLRLLSMSYRLFVFSLLFELKLLFFCVLWLYTLLSIVVPVPRCLRRIVHIPRACQCKIAVLWLRSKWSFVIWSSLLFDDVCIVQHWFSYSSIRTMSFFQQSSSIFPIGYPYYPSPL